MFIAALVMATYHLPVRRPVSSTSQTLPWTPVLSHLTGVYFRNELEPMFFVSNYKVRRLIYVPPLNGDGRFTPENM
jgi:hypothetical protein